jgi:hypothetical protein
VRRVPTDRARRAGPPEIVSAYQTLYGAEAHPSDGEASDDEDGEEDGEDSDDDGEAEDAMAADA